MGWRAIVRLPAMALWLIVCVIAFYPARLLPGRNRVPPVFLAGVAFIAGVEIIRIGKPPANAMLLSNHVSWIDILALAATARAAFVAHDGLQGHPALRWLCDMNDTVFITRDRRQTVGTQVAQIRDALARDGVLALFPEGTTGPGDALLPMKSALLSAIDPPPPGVPVVPVLLRYENAREVAWTTEPGPDNFLRILDRREPVRLTVHFLDPLADDELAGRKAMAAAVTARLGAALSNPPALA